MSEIANKLKMIGSNIVLATSSLFWKKDTSVVLVGAWFGEKFADNSRFLFQYLAENKEKLDLSHVIWVTANQQLCDELNLMGYEALMMGTKESIKWHKIAKYHIICNAGCSQVLTGSSSQSFIIQGDIEGKYSWRAKRINLWHGTGGLKAIDMASNAYKEKKRRHPFLLGVKEALLFHSKLFQRFYVHEGGWGFCYQVATAPIQIRTLHETTGRFRAMLIETGYPRNCECIRLLPIEIEVLQKLKNYRYVILYLPTFRKNSSVDFSSVSTQLEPMLRQNDILWIEKPHTADIRQSQAYQDEFVLKLDSTFDINVLIPHVTLLITDYSSVRMDAMFHHKATIFYVPDFDNYLNGDNGFMADPNEVMCGPKVFSISELEEAIRKYIDDPDACKTANYEEIRSRYWSRNISIAEIWKDIKQVVG